MACESASDRCGPDTQTKTYAYNKHTKNIIIIETVTHVLWACLPHNSTAWRTRDYRLICSLIKYKDRFEISSTICRLISNLKKNHRKKLYIYIIYTYIIISNGLSFTDIVKLLWHNTCDIIADRIQMATYLFDRENTLSLVERRALL